MSLAMLYVMVIYQKIMQTNQPAFDLCHWTNLFKDMAIVTIENLIFDHGNLRSRVYQYWRKLHRCQVRLDISGSSIKSQCLPWNIFPGATFKVNGAPGISFQEPHLKSMVPPEYLSTSHIQSQWHPRNIFP